MSSDRKPEPPPVETLDEESWCRRLFESVPAELVSTSAEDAEWVKTYYFTPWPELCRARLRELIPSRGSVLMLWWARSTERGLDDLMKRYFLKEAGREQAGGGVSAGQQGDDGRVEFGILSRLKGWGNGRG